MLGTNEAFSRVKIDAQLKDQGSDVLNPNAMRFEYVLPDKTKADYVLCDRHGRALAVIEAKRAANCRSMSSRTWTGFPTCRNAIRRRPYTR